MAEVKTPLMAVRIECICDTCHKGKVQATGMTMLSSPPQYEHLCEDCGTRHVLRKRYPYIDYEELKPNGDQPTG